MNPLEFERTLTKGDYRSRIGKHIIFQHSILYHAGVRGQAMAAAEHSLREMFVATAQYRGPYEALSPERLDADWAKNLRDGMKDALSRLGRVGERLRSPATPEARERASQARERASQSRYERRIEEERNRGLTYVRREGERVERELGL